MATLPSYVKILFDGFTEERESGLLRTEFESGPPRQSRVKTRVMETRSAALYIDSKVNYSAFKQWVSDDLAQGAKFFTMTDPLTSGQIEARIVGGVYKGVPMRADLERWRVECLIESWGL